MKSNLNTTIAMLAASAVVLLALVIVTNRPQAYANDTVRRGEYIMTTARVDTNDDLLFVMDLESKKVNVYAPDDTRRSIRLLTTVDLRRLFSVD